MSKAIAPISDAPLYRTDRTALASRVRYDFQDYGFEIAPALSEIFEVIPTALTDEECFLFFLLRDDVANRRWALFNLHIFLKRTGTLEAFARSLGSSVQTVPLAPVTAYHQAAIGYSRDIKTADLFKGAEEVITFIGGQADQLIRDSHFYFMHHHAHCYSGLLHVPGEESRYDTLRGLLFDLVKFS